MSAAADHDRARLGVDETRGVSGTVSSTGLGRFRIPPPPNSAPMRAAPVRSSHARSQANLRRLDDCPQSLDSALIGVRPRFNAPACAGDETPAAPALANSARGFFFRNSRRNASAPCDRRVVLYPRLYAEDRPSARRRFSHRFSARAGVDHDAAPSVSRLPQSPTRQAVAPAPPRLVSTR